MMPDLYMLPSRSVILFRLFSCDLYFQTEKRTDSLGWDFDA